MLFLFGGVCESVWLAVCEEIKRCVFGSDECFTSSVCFVVHLCRSNDLIMTFYPNSLKRGLGAQHMLSPFDGEELFSQPCHWFGPLCSGSWSTQNSPLYNLVFALSTKVSNCSDALKASLINQKICGFQRESFWRVRCCCARSQLWSVRSWSCWEQKKPKVIPWKV